MLLARIQVSVAPAVRLIRIEETHGWGSCTSIVGPLDSTLETSWSASAALYAAAVLDENQILINATGPDSACGCYTSWDRLRGDAQTELAADKVFLAGLAKIDDPMVAGDINLLEGAVSKVDAIIAAGLATSTSIAQFNANSADSLKSAKAIRSSASAKVRADLQLGPSTCAFRLP